MGKIEFIWNHLFPPALRRHIQMVFQTHWPGVIWGAVLASLLFIWRCGDDLSNYRDHGVLSGTHYVRKGDQHPLVGQELLVIFSPDAYEKTPTLENPDSCVFCYPKFVFQHWPSGYDEIRMVKKGYHYAIGLKHRYYTVEFKGIETKGLDTIAVFDLFEKEHKAAKFP